MDLLAYLLYGFLFTFVMIGIFSLIYKGLGRIPKVWQMAWFDDLVESVWDPFNLVFLLLALVGWIVVVPFLGMPKEFMGLLSGSLLAAIVYISHGNFDRIRGRRHRSEGRSTYKRAYR